jgi:hypothetical protein
MQIKTIDDLRNAQNALKPKRSFPLPFPFLVAVTNSEDLEKFYRSTELLLSYNWSITKIGTNENITLDNPVCGLSLDELFKKEFTSLITSKVNSAVLVSRYDLPTEYGYNELERRLPSEFIFSSDIFVPLLVVMLKKGCQRGRSFLRDGRYRRSNIFFVKSDSSSNVFEVSVRWSSRIIERSSVEGWSVSTRLVTEQLALPRTSCLYVNRK